MVEPLKIFSKPALSLHRDRAADKICDHNFLFEETAKRLVDRIKDTKRLFPVALDIGCHGGEIVKELRNQESVKSFFSAELSPKMAKNNCKGRTIVCDDEFLPFASNSFDLILSNLNLHWVNDLPGAFLQMRKALRPDGLLLASMLGGNTLNELRLAIYEAEMEVEKGWSPRFSPLADLKDLGNLLHRAGFALPVADIETITVSYDHPLKLMLDLRGMGETNANVDRRKTFSRRSTLFRAVEIYKENFAQKDGRIPATFEIITLTAWAPDPRQPKPLARGSAKRSLKDALEP
ncbi:MAG: SAM-dependent methyltransferase [Magnetovibrio sp.]|nr:SAM-dependent methyltransferase [Magnetovibrio sp.]|tara:strand:+ start:1079 stop:1954 length:876 start_codon:yes stop_codon:yes gene_type:complete